MLPYGVGFGKYGPSLGHSLFNEQNGTGVIAIKRFVYSACDAVALPLPKQLPLQCSTHTANILCCTNSRPVVLRPVLCDHSVFNEHGVTNAIAVERFVCSARDGYLYAVALPLS
jgi:hypothetical protein